MNLLELRNRIRDKAIDNSLTYTEIETLFDVNLLLEQTMPCLMWRYSGETNNFDEVGTEMSLNVYLITTFPDSVRVETDIYQRDYIVTQQNALRTYFYDWLQDMPFESGDDYLEILSTEEIPIAERLGINEFLTVDFRVNISIKRDFCVDPEQIAPTPSQVQVYFNDVLRYTQACNVDLELILKNQDGDLINDATFNGYEIVVTQGGGGQVNININGVLWDVIDAGETENIIVRQSSGSTQVGSKQGQYYRIADSVITLEDALGAVIGAINVKAEDAETIVAPSARVSNSDDSYDVNVVSGGDLELPDENITLNGGAFLTKPSVKNQDIELVDTGDAPITPDSVVGNKIVVNTSAGCSSKGLMPLQTGQTTSYASGDDGDLQRGRLVNYTTLPYNNGFGTTDRFTDELGGQTFTNNIIIDWSTWDGGTDVNGYILSLNSDSNNTRQNWATWMSGQPYTTDGFGDWYVVNINEINNLMKYESINGLNGYPFNNPTNAFGDLWTSTTFFTNTGQAIIKNRNTNVFRNTSKIDTHNSMWVRTFTWDGASLT
jgi:hypothetical protein